MSRLSDTRRVALAAAVLILTIVAAQALGVATAPTGQTASTAQVLGRAGYAYLGGLRTFAAAVLWNRIEPQFHGYYGHVPLSKQTYMLPTLRLVVALDPQFTQAYYISSFMVYQRSPEQGIALAREGAAKNPSSGIMHANLAQLLFIADKVDNREEILRNVALGLQRDAVWLDESQEYEGLAIMMQALNALGERQDAHAVEVRLERMRSGGADLGDHDHDQDGEQDH